MRQQAFTAVVLVVGFVGCASWKSRPVEDWTARDATRVLRQSPWVTSEGVRVLTRPRGSPNVWSGREWIRFSWLAEPLRAAIDRREEVRPGSSIRYSSASGARSGSFSAMLQEMEFPVPNPILILVTSGLLPDLLASEGGPQMEQASLQVGDRVVPAINVLFQVNRVTHRKSPDGVAGATVTIENLGQNPEGGQAVEKMAWSYVVPEFRDTFTANHPTRSILLIFPREIDGEPTVTPSAKDAVVTIPLKERSLKTTFHPNKMKFRGQFEF